MKLRNPLLLLVNEYLIDSPAPRNLNYNWNYGSLLGLILVILIISGITLAFHYTPHVDLAFNAVEHIMRDVNNGWLIRYIHANAASLFFVVVYLHMGKALYYGSYQQPRQALWSIGVIIFLIMIVTAFLGYTLPFGQMSYWAAAVITNLLSVIHMDLVYLIWGGFNVDNPTLNRFFGLHFLLPFLLSGLVLLHLMHLHQHASNNSLGISSLSDRIRFHPYYTSKDLITVFILFGALSLLVFYYPMVLGHSDNSIMANPLVTPHHIVPEWYFLPFYAILRAIPNKTLGVLALLSAILVLFLLPLKSRTPRTLRFLPLQELGYYIFTANFVLLAALGGLPLEYPYLPLSGLATILYFAYILALLVF
jgi:ubiquinol-cytochrome c reductase cytochrome b subunit